jgi:hypothetical protein
MARTSYMPVLGTAIESAFTGPRTPYTRQRAKTVPAKPRVARKTACRGAAVRKALRDERS